MGIRGRKVTLRAIEEGDLPALHRWANDPELTDLLASWSFPRSMASVRGWFERLESDSLNQRFAIEAPDLGLIGTTNLVDIDWKNNHAFTGMQIGEKQARGRGYGVDTVMTIMRYAFDELHFERLDGSIIEYNQPSIELYCKRLGWQEEGRQRNWYHRRGRYWDKILVGITRANYLALCEETDYWAD